ncbi:MAG: 16S rRNA (cytidine(1402)-2'-O)-methyltransferase [Bacteroidales bacterium]|nr:16S rRNA (cytidine(1402)-2'-O)-methyltransferase [Bacteroidales bacterium]
MKNDVSKLYLVPTPIGNLEDMTYRAVRILSEVHTILAEDTRTTAKLLSHYNIQNNIVSYHQFNEHQKVDEFVQRLENGETMAVVTDAGTPGISDPGFLLARACVAAGIEIETLPGATALIPALVNSGLPCDRFYFEGFLPHKKGRQTRLQFLSQQEQTFVLYESPFRLCKTLEQLIEVCGTERRCSVARELTKMFEENFRGSLQEILAHFSNKEVKGEIVIVVAGKE